MDLLREFLSNLFSEWLPNQTQLTNLIVKVLMVIVWCLIGYLVHLITKFLVARMKAKEKRLVKRQKTIAALVISITRYVFWFIIIMMILLEMGFDVAPILASAGILGFAVGFGAQELIKDLISGFFIIFEQAFNVGDIIEVNNFKGTVIDIGIRRTKIVNYKNEVRLINNGDIRTITQFSIGESVGVVEFQVSPNFDLNLFETDQFKAILNQFNDNVNMLEAPKLVGVVDSLLHQVTLRVTFVTLNGKHTALERQLKKEILMFIRKVRNE